MLADVKQAYRKLTSLDLAGKITGDFDVDGQKESHSLEFTTSFSAPNLFRLETKDDAVFGSTGERMYVYAKSRNLFLAVDAPHDAYPRPICPTPSPI